jgi:hypothetical protein
VPTEHDAEWVTDSVGEDSATSCGCAVSSSGTGGQKARKGADLGDARRLHPGADGVPVYLMTIRGRFVCNTCRYTIIEAANATTPASNQENSGGLLRHLLEGEEPGNAPLSYRY